MADVVAAEMFGPLLWREAVRRGVSAQSPVVVIGDGAAWIWNIADSYFKGIYEGEWSGVALRSVRGAAISLYPDPNAQGSFASTAILGRCPYFQQVLAAFECELESVRLLKLRAGSEIREHRDYKLGLEDGVLRVHVPITTNPGVEFVLEGQRISMGEGEAWYLDFNRPHSVANRGDTNRVHLVIDGIVNDWVRSLFPAT